MKHPLLAKLGLVENLSPADEALVTDLMQTRGIIPRWSDIISQGANPHVVHVILEGWAARYSVAKNGKRRIMAILLPGDFCDIHVSMLEAMDHGIVAITDCEVGYMDRQAVDLITRSTPALTRAFWRATLVDEAILRQWLINDGTKEAHAALAHLICELHLRLELVGRAETDRLELPLTQADLADALGITAVHLNRVAKRLQADGLIENGRKSLIITDIAALRRLADFRTNYLHLRKEPQPALAS